MLEIEVQNRFLLPVLEPMIAGNPTVVLVDLSVPLLPAVEGPLGHFHPTQDPLGRHLGSILPVLDVIHHCIASFMGNPNSVQGSPSAFFNWTCSSKSSETTSFFVCSFFSSCSIFLT